MDLDDVLKIKDDITTSAMKTMNYKLQFLNF